jgi:hypothetical protein
MERRMEYAFPRRTLRRNGFRNFSEGGGMGKAERLKRLLASDKRTALLMDEARRSMNDRRDIALKVAATA